MGISRLVFLFLAWISSDLFSSCRDLDLSRVSGTEIFGAILLLLGFMLPG